jgi:hypothetical protein
MDGWMDDGWMDGQGRTGTVTAVDGHRAGLDAIPDVAAVAASFAGTVVLRSHDEFNPSCDVQVSVS